jgi:anaerobic magnesium-protoporphyrin IX monomethyl ester cyclase
VTQTKKIIFITPPYHCGVAEVIGRWMPLNLVYLAGAARQAGLVAGIYDAAAKNHGYPEIEMHMREMTADYVASTAMTATINDAVKTLELVKRINPGTVTILGGVHPTFMYEEVLAAAPAVVDYIVIGEGEATLRHLLAVLESGEDPVTVPGVAFLREGSVVRTARRHLVEDLDDLPMAWDLLEWEDYSYFVIPDSRLGAISTSRGCDHDCIFCSQQKFWEKTWRARNPVNVVEELEYLHAACKVNVVLITDEYPTRSRERWENFLDLLMARDLPIHFLMETRPEDIVRDRDIIWKYRKAGIIHISIGVEATDQGILDAIRKNVRSDVARQALELIHEQGIVSETSFIIGFPDETPEHINDTMKLVRHYNPDNANFMALTPWPYSDMYQDVKQYIRQWDYSKYNLVDPVLEPKNMSMLQVDVALADCFRKFYMGKILDVMTMKDDFKRGYLLRATKLFMSSPFVIRKLGIGLLGKIKLKVEGGKTDGQGGGN